MKITMTRAAAMLLLLLTGALFPAFAQQPQKTVLENYTLEQCISYAIEHSNAVQNAKIDADIAKAKVGEVKSAGLPQVNAHLDLTHNVQVQRVFFMADRFNPMAKRDSIAVAAFQLPYSGIANVSVQQMIFNGSYFLGLKAAATFTELSEKSLQQSKNEIAAGVSKAYYSVLINDDRLQLLEQNYLRLEQLHKDTKAMFENGLVEKIDVDRISVSLNNLKIEREKMKRVRELSHSLLKFQMGMADTDDITFSQTLRTLKLDTAATSAAADYNQRVEFSMLHTQRELDLLQVRNRRSGYLPSVFLVANGGANTGVMKPGQLFNLADRWYSFFFYGIRISVPVFDGRQKSFQLQQSQLALKKTENNLKEMTRAIDMQVRQATVVLQNHIESLDAQKSNMELAAEINRVAKVKYKEGVGSNLEVLNAETAFKEAELNYYTTLYEALMAKVELDRARGELGEK